MTPKATLSLHFVLHELATNAAKYGAPAMDVGRVDIQWSMEQKAEGPFLRLTWIESGGPKVTVPKRRGFGTTDIENSVGYELNGQTTMQFLEQGLQCEFLIPWRNEIGFAADTRGGKH